MIKKTIYQWEESDIVAGMLVVKFPKSDIGYGMSTCYMIGYDTTMKSSDKYCFISMSDGMVPKRRCTKAGVAEHLNSSGYIPVDADTMHKMFQYDVKRKTSQAAVETSTQEISNVC